MILDEHLFRREHAKMIAALTRVFGVHNLALAEDVVQDAFCRALEVWKVRGVPEHPAAWLMATAKRRAVDVMRRERTARTFAPEVARLVEEEWTPAVDAAFGAHAIRDEQLRMMFSCCHPRLAPDAQVALILNVLCGFGAPEIAAAFLAGRAAIEKRIVRGKRALAAVGRLFDLTDADFAPRLATVQRALYLLFNEGYHGGSADAAVRADLCAEAIRLVNLLREHPGADTPTTRALAALMHLHAARLPARLDAGGDLNPLAEQDRALWDPRLLHEGFELVAAASTGTELSAHHLEAAIAAQHAAAPDLASTEWGRIVEMYDMLMALAPSPVVALNRAIALAERDGPAAGLAALGAIEDVERLARYPFHAAALGDMHARLGDHAAAREHFTAALRVARNAAERRFLERRLRE